MKICVSASCIFLISFVLTANTLYNVDMAHALVKVTNDYFKLPSRIIFYLSKDNDSKFSDAISEGHVALVVLQEPPMTPIEELKKWISYKCDTLVVIGKLNKSLEELSVWEELDWNSRGKTLIVMEGTLEQVRRIIEFSWQSSRTLDVAVANIINSTIHFYTWTPYQLNQCDEVKHLNYVAVWKNNHFTMNGTLYNETKFTSLNQCVLTVTCYPVFPFVLFGFTDGVEIRIVDALKEYFNFQIRFKFIPHNEVFWLPVIKNKTHKRLNGAFRLLMNHEADMAMGGITAQVDRYTYSSPLYPYIIERLIWIVPAPRVVNPVQNVFRVFTPLLWILILLSLGIVSASVFLTQDKIVKELNSSFFYSLGVILNGMPSFKTKNWPLRFITIATVFLAIHIFVAYQSSLIFLLTTSILEKSYEKVEEVVEDGLELIIFTGGEKLVEQAVRYKSIELGKYGVVQDFIGSINKAAFNRSAFLLFPESPSFFSTWAYTQKDRSYLITLPNPFMVLPISIHLSHGSPLLRVFNNKIQRLVDAGIITYWKKEIFTSASRKYHMVGNVKSSGLKPLSMQHLTGAFTGFLTFLIISLATFFIEIISFYVSKCKKTKSITNKLSMFPNQSKL